MLLALLDEPGGAGDSGAPWGVLALITAYLGWVGWSSWLTWWRYGRLPLAERLQHRGRFKADAFLRHPWVYPAGSAFAVLAVAFIWIAWFFG